MYFQNPGILKCDLNKDNTTGCTIVSGGKAPEISALKEELEAAEENW